MVPIGGESGTLVRAIRGCAQRLGIAHFGALLERLAARFERDLHLGQLGEPGRGGREGFGCHLVGRVGLAEFPAELFVAAVGLAEGRRAPLGRDARVPPVVGEKSFGRGLGFGESAKCLALLVQSPERLSDGGDQRRLQRRQRLGQRMGQQFLVRLLGKLGLAQLDQQVDQRIVAVGAQTEQCLVHGSSVVRCGVVHRAGSFHRVPQLLPAQRHPGRTEQRQLRPDPLTGHEEPVPRDAASGNGLETGADGAVYAGAVGPQPAELQPGVAEPLGVRMFPAQQKVPLHALVPVTVGLDPVRGQLAVQQERQGQREHLGLPGAVVATQQQAPVVEVEFLDVVVEQVDQPGTQRLPAFPLWNRHLDRRCDAHLRRALPFDRSAGPVRMVGAVTA